MVHASKLERYLGADQVATLAFLEVTKPATTATTYSGMINTVAG